MKTLFLLILALVSPIKGWGCDEGAGSSGCADVSIEYSAEEAFRMGVAYSTGEGQVENSTQAVHWMRVAAIKGHLYAQFNLGEAYINGYGLPQNYADGIEWLKRASNGGLADAQVSLGLKYDEGVGVTRDPEMAVKWFRKAARQGNRDGLNNLGIAYAVGEGVLKDNIQAYIWFERGRLAGHPLSGEYRERVAMEMSPREIREAQRVMREKGNDDVSGAEVISTQ